MTEPTGPPAPPGHADDGGRHGDGAASGSAADDPGVVGHPPQRGRGGHLAGTGSGRLGLAAAAARRRHLPDRQGAGPGRAGRLPVHHRAVPDGDPASTRGAAAPPSRPQVALRARGAAGRRHLPRRPRLLRRVADQLARQAAGRSGHEGREQRQALARDRPAAREVRRPRQGHQEPLEHHSVARRTADQQRHHHREGGHRIPGRLAAGPADDVLPAARRRQGVGILRRDVPRRPPVRGSTTRAGPAGTPSAATCAGSSSSRSSTARPSRSCC